MVDVNNKNSTEDKATKPGYDGRLGYYKVIENNMNQLSQSIMLNDKQTWISTLWSLFFLTRPYIKGSKAKEILKENILSTLQKHNENLIINKENKPFTILTVGVNGTGKTTTIAKLASKFKNEGHSVMLAAADTFRAAAIEQLEIWGDRVGCKVIKHKHGADPSAVAFDALKSAKANNIDNGFVDISAIYSGATLVKRGADVWVVTGNISEVA